ncbi:hypothetical protein NJH83_29480 [Pseudomonas chlororaphis]|uniref:hypothetical protein n=1 Tax=Pseudomonas chlororaphis TaxID=587753 RepID=UPI00209B1535|nr:hypothetical protein [Pseudomonas chlororaphis]MCO7614370.1 hypothetical protein [Pseudomonas chlororaphis]
MTDYTELKRLAVAAQNDNGDYVALNEYGMAVPPAVVLALLAEIERLEGLRPEPPPRPPEGVGLPRYGLRWNGAQLPLATPMDDGYWTPWHLAAQLKAANEVGVLTELKP